MKKILSNILIGVSILSVSNVAFANPDPFNDLYTANPYATAIQYLQDEGIVEGYDTGKFESDQSITRAEFLKIVMETAEKEKKGKDCYKDVSDEWYAPYICGATEAGIVSGYGDKTFKPNQEINFAEASKIIVNTLKLKLELAKTDKWYESFIKTLEIEKAIPAGIDSSSHLLTRGEMAELIWRIQTDKTYKTSNTFKNLEEGIALPEYGNTLQTFDSCANVTAFISDHQKDYNNYRYFEEEMMLDFQTMDAVPMATNAERTMNTMNETDKAVAGAATHSETNTQVKGVDEADIIKNDGEYIYTVNGSTVRVIDARKPDALKEISIVDVKDPEFYPEELYLDDKRLIVSGYSYSNNWNNDYTSLQNVYIFDIEDKANIELIKEFKFEGNQVTSRKIGNKLYMVMEKYIPYYYDTPMPVIPMPLYKTNESEDLIQPAKCGEIMYMPGIVGEPHFVAIYAIDTANTDAKINSSVVLGNAETIYASKDNIYLTDYEYSNVMYSRKTAGITEPYTRQPDETYIHKFALNDGDVEYKGVGAVPGTINNQFSIDESGKDLRVATTTNQQWWGADDMSNNIYVLDNEKMEIAESLEGLAEGEKIYSARFVGNRAYIVTFKQVDPLFVIDLGDRTKSIAPKVLGQLKIPGVSKYMHPIDENHIIGFGLDSVENENSNNAWFQGLKMSIFDVSDVENPKELDKVIIGDRGSSSELEYDHKALLFDKEKAIIGFPVTIAEIPQSVKDNLDLETWQYGDTVFQGAYVYNFDVEKGFHLAGKISHYSDDALGANFHYYDRYDSGKNINRIIYMGDNYFTTSDGYVKATSMDKFEEVDMLELEKIEHEPYYDNDIIPFGLEEPIETTSEPIE